MWLAVSGILLLFLCVNPTLSRDVCSDADMKDAIVKLANIMKESTVKLDRHETRERLMDEYIKKAFGVLSKRVSVVDHFGAQFTKIGDQISEIELLSSQRDARERIQMQKTADLIQNLESRLEARLSQLNNAIIEVNQRIESTEPTPIAESVSAVDIMSKLNDTESNFIERITRIEASLEKLADKNKEEAAKRDEKLESVLSERDEKDRIQMQKTEELLTNLENKLKIRLEAINDTIHEVNEHVEPTQPTTTEESVSASDIISKLNDAEKHFLENVARIETRLNSMVTKDEDDITRQFENLENIYTEVQNITGRLEDIENSVDKIQETVTKVAEKLAEQPVNIEAIIDRQTKALENVTELVKDTVNLIQDIPTTSDVLGLHNQTLSALQEVKFGLQTAMKDELDGVIKNVTDNNDEIIDSIGDLRKDLGIDSQNVKAKLSEIVHRQEAMVSTADELLNPNRNLELGFEQIRLDISQLITNIGGAIKTTLSDKLNGLSNNIINNQNKTVADLTNKFELELKQVWRQMESMFHEMNTNTLTLEKLNKQNEAYVNAAINTMDGMGIKVGDMKTQVDDDLNYLLLRLSLVKTEFDQLKSMLVPALNNMKTSLREVRQEAEVLSNQGPHPLPDEYRRLEDDQTPRIMTRPKDELGALPAS